MLPDSDTVAGTASDLIPHGPCLMYLIVFDAFPRQVEVLEGEDARTLGSIAQVSSGNLQLSFYQSWNHTATATVSGCFSVTNMIEECRDNVNRVHVFH